MRNKYLIIPVIALLLMSCNKTDNNINTEVQQVVESSTVEYVEEQISGLESYDNLSEEEWKKQLESKQDFIWIYNKGIHLPSDISVLDNVLIPSEFIYKYEDKDGNMHDSSVEFAITDTSDKIKESVAGIKSNVKTWHKGYLVYKLAGTDPRKSADVEVDFDITKASDKSIMIDALRVSSLTGLDEEDFLIVGRFTLGSQVDSAIKSKNFYTVLDSEGRIVIYQWGYQGRYSD